DAFAQIARRVEEACFDLLFIDDQLAIIDTSAQSGPRVARAAYFEPVTLLAALAAITNRVGLVATVSTTFNEPYNLARKLASLDQISGGRAAWNIVTSNTEIEARNFGQASHLLHDRRYERAEEFVDVVVSLWSSFDDDAFVYDKEGGIVYDHAKMHPV